MKHTKVIYSYIFQYRNSQSQISLKYIKKVELQPVGCQFLDPAAHKDHEDIFISWFKIGLGKFIANEIYKQILNGIGQNVTSSVLT